MKATGIDNLLSSMGLSGDLRDQVLEAWNTVTEQNKQEAVEQVREEYREKYNEDMEAMMKAADAIVNETLEKELSEFNEDRSKLHEGKKALLKNLKKVKKLKESQEEHFEKRLAVFEGLVMETLKTELNEFAEDRQKLEESVNKERLKLVREQMKSRKLAESKEKALNLLVSDVLKEELTEFSQDRQKYNETIEKMENLMVSQLTEELSEFQEDRKQLQERRVELEKEYDTKLDEAKNVFIKRASKSAEKLVNETLASEIGALKEDIQAARQNTFGRKLFEAFASEFYYSHLSENTEISKISKQLKESEENAKKLQKIVKEQADAINNTRQELKEARETSVREKTISKLVNPLAPTQKKIMTRLLEGVAVDKLEKSFERYLPSVLEQRSTKPQAKKDAVQKGEGRKQLSEATGNRKPQTKQTSTPATAEVSPMDDEIVKILQQAGIASK